MINVCLVYFDAILVVGWNLVTLSVTVLMFYISKAWLGSVFYFLSYNYTRDVHVLNSDDFFGHAMYIMWSHLVPRIVLHDFRFWAFTLIWPSVQEHFFIPCTVPALKSCILCMIHYCILPALYSIYIYGRSKAVMLVYIIGWYSKFSTLAATIHTYALFRNGA